MKDERFGKTESENKELAEVRKELAEERAAMELYGAEGKPEEGLNTETGVSGGPMNTISGVLLASSSGSATLSAGNVYETYAIAMCAIGKVTNGAHGEDYF